MQRRRDIAIESWRALGGGHSGARCCFGPRRRYLSPRRAQRAQSRTPQSHLNIEWVPHSWMLLEPSVEMLTGATSPIPPRGVSRSWHRDDAPITRRQLSDAMSSWFLRWMDFVSFVVRNMASKGLDSIWPRDDSPPSRPKLNHAMFAFFAMKPKSVLKPPRSTGRTATKSSTYRCPLCASVKGCRVHIFGISLASQPRITECMNRAPFSDFRAARAILERLGPNGSS